MDHNVHMEAVTAAEDAIQFPANCGMMVAVWPMVADEVGHRLKSQIGCLPLHSVQHGQRSENNITNKHITVLHAIGKINQIN